MSVFPLNIVTKEDTPERLAALANIEAKYITYAADINIIVAALKELYGKNAVIEDGTGKKWEVRKKDGNNNISAFETGDKAEAYVDAGETHWVEGLIEDPSFNGVADVQDKSKFFITNEKYKESS